MFRFGFFEKLSIGNKIRLGFGLTSLLFLTVVLQYHLTVFRTLSSYEDLLSVYEAQKYHSLNIHRYMLEARRSEKDFLTRKGFEYVKRVKKHVDMVAEEAAALSPIEQRVTGAHVAERIGRYMQDYHVSFLNIVEAWEIKGLDHESGLQGRFRTTIHQVETKAKGLKTGALYLTLLQIRRGEKDLGLRRSTQYVERVRELGHRFLAQLAASSLDAQTKDAATRGMEDYLRQFDGYAEQVLANQDVNGGMGEFRDIAHDLEGLLRAHYVPDLEKHILMLRRNEKDYLLRGDKSYVESARSTIGHIMDNIARSEVPIEKKQSMRDQIRAYERDFIALVEQNDRIIALTAQMRDAVHRIEPLVISNVRETIARVEQASVNTRELSEQKAFLALTVSIAAVLLGVYFSVVIARHITRPVATLLGLAELVSGSEGESAEIGEIGNQDEIAALAGAMGHMAGSHRQMLSRLAVHKDNLDEAASAINDRCDVLEAMADDKGEPVEGSSDEGTPTRNFRELHDSLTRSKADLAAVSEGLKNILDRYREW